MAKFHESDPAVVYRYGIRRPDRATSSPLIDEMRLATVYYDALVRIHRERTSAYRAKRRELFPDYEALERRSTDLSNAIAHERQMAKSVNGAKRRRVIDPARKARIDAAKMELREVCDALKRMREEIAVAEIDAHIRSTERSLSEADEADEMRADRIRKKLRKLREKRQALGEDSPISESHGEAAEKFAQFAVESVERMTAQQKAARAEWPCSWGTGGAVEMAVAAAAAAAAAHGMPQFKIPFHEKDKPFWTAGPGEVDPFDLEAALLEGKFEVQIQHGMTVEEAFAGEDTRLRIDDLPHRDAIHRVSNAHRLTKLHLRIGSEGRAPVWVTVPLIYHRPLPPDARIKRVAIMLRHAGNRPCWSACFTVARKRGWAKDDTARSGEVGIDVGWRLVPEGLRTAYWVGSDGAEGELILPRKWLEGWATIEERQGARARAFDEARDRLADWLDDRLRSGAEIPAWLAERAEHLRLWQSAHRLWRLASDWISRRFDGDAEMYDWLRSWWREERKAHTGIEGQRRRLLNQRAAIYTEFVVRMRRTYRTAHVEKLNLNRMQRTPEPEEESSDGALLHYSRLASVGNLLERIREQCAETIAEPAKDTSRRCSACGFVRAIDGRELLQTCDECGATEDQDRRAAVNLLRQRLRRAE